jgi:hypothetical protein
MKDESRLCSQILRRTFALAATAKPFCEKNKKQRAEKIELTNFFFWRSRVFFPSTIFIILYLFYCCSLLVYAFASAESTAAFSAEKKICINRNRKKIAKKRGRKARILGLCRCE